MMDKLIVLTESMKAFATLLHNLYFNYSNIAKRDLIIDYLKSTRDPDRGYAIGVLTGALTFNNVKSNLIRKLIKEHMDSTLVDMSYDYVGDLADTVSLLWETSSLAMNNSLPALHEIIHQLNLLPKTQISDYLTMQLNQMDVTQRWAFLKLITGSLRVGVSSRFVKQTLADYGNVTIDEIESVWPAQKPPYIDLLAWLEKKIRKPVLHPMQQFHPLMLSHPIAEDEWKEFDANAYAAEWKWDGIRIQIVSDGNTGRIFSRNGDEISHAFPDIVESCNFKAILDGELLIHHTERLGSFNELQQRLNRKKASKELIKKYPAHVRLYDMLFEQNEDIRSLTYLERRSCLEKWWRRNQPKRMDLSPVLSFSSLAELNEYRMRCRAVEHEMIEGIMLKRKDSTYISGRPRGYWYKWKRDPLIIDTVLMYAQRGHGKRSSYYSDYSFGVWQENQLVPIGKAYGGFTDMELLQLDRWIRQHTTNRFGPIREVEPLLVLEIAFDSMQLSNRHKSGIALRFPRINRIRWDKPAAEADQLETVRLLLPRHE